MLSLLFMAKKRKDSLEEKVRLVQEGNQNLQNELIDSYKPFIAKTVSSVCKRYIRESDDEFSIGLIAFNEAIQKYAPEKGRSLLSFAEVLVKRRVIDYIRKQMKNQDLSLDFSSDRNDDELSRSKIEEELSIEYFHKKMEENRRKEEIVQFQKKLREYGLTLSDLIEQSPKHSDARKNAMLVARTIVQNDEMRHLLIEKKKLPIKHLEKRVQVSRKTIERNRKYIIAIALILTEDYEFLQDYIKGVLET